MKRKAIIAAGSIAVFLLCSIFVVSGAWANDPVGEPGRSSGKKNPLKNVYFGEQHMHTRNSFDAFTIGVSATWDDAYNFAKGKEVKLSTTGEKMKRRTPYDFVAITDHSEYYGVLKEFDDPKSDLSKTDFAKSIVAGVKDPSKAGPAVQKLIQTLVKSEPLPEYVTPELRMGMWQKFIKTADAHNEPGKFTALYAYEWTSIPNGANMHRNIFFKDKPAAVPFSSFDSVLPQDLWTYLEIQRNQGIDVFAIPHNSNVQIPGRAHGCALRPASAGQRAAVRDPPDQGEFRGPSVAVTQRRVREFRAVPEPDQPRHTLCDQRRLLPSGPGRRHEDRKQAWL
jgi:hypothetical protein